MTHIDTTKALIKELQNNSERLNRESFDLKMKIRKNNEDLTKALLTLEKLEKKELMDMTRPVN